MSETPKKQASGSVAQRLEQGTHNPLQQIDGSENPANSASKPSAKAAQVPNSSQDSSRLNTVPGFVFGTIEVCQWFMSKPFCGDRQLAVIRSICSNDLLAYGYFNHRNIVYPLKRWLRPRSIEQTPWMPGVYAVFHRGRLIYIGETACVRRRLGNHNLQRIISRFFSPRSNLRVAVRIEPDLGARKALEASLIGRLKPPFNSRGVNVSKRGAR